MVRAKFLKSFTLIDVSLALIHSCEDPGGEQGTSVPKNRSCLIKRCKSTNNFM